MTKYVAADKNNIKMIKEFCSAHRTKVSTTRLSHTDEYLIKIKCSLYTWLMLKKVLPLDKPVKVYRTES